MTVKANHAEIARWCGSLNVDVVSGWEKGIGPLRRVGRRLADHWPPDHLEGARFSEWMRGYEAAKRYKAACLTKSVHFVGTRTDGQDVVLRFKGWSASRRAIVTRLEGQGCVGEVAVYYFEGSELKRTVRCGI